MRGLDVTETTAPLDSLFIEASRRGLTTIGIGDGGNEIGMGRVLKGVTRADSAGLALLLEWLRRSERAGCSISFVNVPEQLMSIARICGLEGILPLSH